MSERLSDFLNSLQLDPPASDQQTAPTPRAGYATASVFAGKGSTNYAVGTLYDIDITIIGSKVGISAINQVEVRKIRSSVYVGPDQSRDQFIKAESSLDFHGLAVLENVRGSGRRSDAIRLLTATTPDNTPVYELSPDWAEGEASPKLLPAPPHCRLLLDLTTEASQVTEQFGHDLLDYSRTLKANGSQLVVTVTPRIWTPCRVLMKEYTVNLVPREAKLIVRAHIALRGGPSALISWLDEEPLQGLMAEMYARQASPQEGVELAERLLSARFEDLGLIVDAQRKWEKDIHDQLDCRQVGWADRRILLITVAVLNGAASSAIGTASRQLARSLGHTKLPLYMSLESEGWTTRIRAIDAIAKDDRTWLNLDKPGLDWAIIEWLWRDQPELHQPFLDWVAVLTRSPATRLYADRLAEVLAHLTRVYRSPEIFDKMFSWLKREKGAGVVECQLAEDALAKLLIDDSAGGLAQGRMWHWAYRGSTAAIAPLARLCAGPFGTKLPQVALARLRHLEARADHPAASIAVSKAVRFLAGQDDLRPLVTNKSLEWSREGVSRRTGLLALVSLIDSRPDDSVAALLVQDAMTDVQMLLLLSEAWLTLTTHGDQAEIAEITRHWCVLREEGRLHGATVDRIWAASVAAIVREQPKAAFIEAMTDRTRSEMLLLSIRQMREAVEQALDSPILGESNDAVLTEQSQLVTVEVDAPIDHSGISPSQIDAIAEEPDGTLGT
ncbi:hypothetical protein Rhe02_74690 [Rhizocola hellebori]|uniref:Uncharacterized protein n=1 Tax=Rhizocola hellebori TaxID=1392758 RepID=A0A8J3VKC6_9ACTN|nr:hypothetical protein [Rhizocola hellebori]GIH09402.1 hypothetical protein Rhe02_74690 [Rhizocola hellebori]